MAAGKEFQHDVCRFGLVHLRSTTEFNTSAPPLGIPDVSQDLLHLILKRDYPDWVGVSFSKDGTYSGKVVSSLQIDLFAEDPDVTFDPVPAKAFDPFDIRICDTRLMGEIETQFGWGNERSFLVDVVTKDFSEGPIENVSSSVVIPERPSA